MALNRDKYRKIVGGITTAESQAESQAETPAADATSPETEAVVANIVEVPPQEEQGGEPAAQERAAIEPRSEEPRRFAKRGRPKGRKDEVAASKNRKVKVSLFLSETLVNDLYEWAHEDRIHPGEMFERALKPFHEREAKRRNAGKE